MMHKNIILVGNPNTGKTTLFNSLTNSFERVSNWHGVTVGVKQKTTMIGDIKINVTDLPGIYSLQGYSNEEKIAIKYLNEHKDDLIINICDANNIKRNLLLTAELINQGFNVVVALNMFQENKKCKYDKLSQELGVEIIEIDARNIRLLDNLINYVTNKKVQKMQILL